MGRGGSRLDHIYQPARHPLLARYTDRERRECQSALPPAAFSRQYSARLLLMIGNLGFVRWTTAVSRGLHGAPRGNPAPSCVSRCSQRLCGARARLRSFVVVIVIKAANLDEPTSLARLLVFALPSSPPHSLPAQLPVCPQYCASFHCGRADRDRPFNVAGNRNTGC